MKVSIVITTYKRSSFLMRAIQSCFAQDFSGEIEIIVVDDNGKRTSEQIDTEQSLSELIESDRINYIALEKNGGACFARNTGAKYATGKYLFFLDDDDEFMPNKVSQQVQNLESNVQYEADICAFQKKVAGKDFPASDSDPVVGDLKHFIMHGNYYTPMLCIKKTVFEEIGGFPETPKYQDIYFMYHVLEKGIQVHTSNQKLYILNEHKHERISNNTVGKTKLAVDKLRSFAQKHRNIFNNDEWKLVETRLNSLCGYAYYVSSYSNRLKSIHLWQKCYKLSNDKKYLIIILKCFIPNTIIKVLEKNKKSHA